jgi:hypothetical protein
MRRTPRARPGDNHHHLEIRETNTVSLIQSSNSNENSNAEQEVAVDVHDSADSDEARVRAATSEATETMRTLIEKEKEERRAGYSELKSLMESILGKLRNNDSNGTISSSENDQLDPPLPVNENNVENNVTPLPTPTLSSASVVENSKAGGAVAIPHFSGGNDTDVWDKVRQDLRGQGAR